MSNHSVRTEISSSGRAGAAMKRHIAHQTNPSTVIIPPTPEKLGALLEPVLSRECMIIAAFLFGSATKGRMRAGSDIDVGIILESDCLRPDRKQLLDRLIPLLGRAVRHDVHLSILNDASYLLRAQVMHEGRLIHVADLEKLARFRMISTALYADFAPILEMTRSGLERKLLERHGA